MLWGIDLQSWLTGLVIGFAIIGYRAMAGRMAELEADKETRVSERLSIRREMERVEDAHRMHRNAVDRDINAQRRDIERMALQLDAVEARVHQHLMTPQERQERMQAWMAEAERLNIDLTRIMKDLA